MSGRRSMAKKRVRKTKPAKKRSIPDKTSDGSRSVKEMFTATKKAQKNAQTDTKSDRKRPSSVVPGPSEKLAKTDLEEVSYRKEDHKFFMRLACLAATRSKDDRTQVGAVIVRDGRQIVATGYNGHIQIRGLDNDTELPWTRQEKEHYVCHAEFNALLNKSGADLKGCTIYVTLYPCYECAKLIIEAGIKTIIYYESPREENGIVKKDYKASTSMIKSTKMSVEARSYSNILKGCARDVPVPRQMKKFEIDPAISKKISWNDYFMAMAYMAARRSDDPTTQVGACIVNDKRRVVGIGYNAMPHGCVGLPWDGHGETKLADNWLDTKYPYVIHAVPMAILNKNIADLAGCTVYVTMYPDSDCARMIVQSGIRRVFYMGKKRHDKRTKVAETIFNTVMQSDEEHMNVIEFKPSVDRIVIEDTVSGETISVFDPNGIISRERSAQPSAGSQATT